MRILILPALLAAALCGCERNRATAGDRVEIRPGSDDHVKAELDGSIRSSLKIEGAATRMENGFLVVQMSVRNGTGRNVPCEWRTVFHDKDGFDLPVTSNPWSPVVINSNQTMPLTKTAPQPGAEKATFYIREASPIRK